VTCSSEQLLIMHPYQQKVKAAKQLVKSKQFPSVQDVEGRVWPGERYHLMYTQWFKGYFLYKISGVSGALEEYTGFTWWNFDIQMANDKEHSDDFEQPLPATEIKAWLVLNYGQLVAADYEHLINILHLQHTPDGCAVHHVRNSYNWQQALAWLTEQRAWATASGSTVAASIAPSTAPTTINPWLPLLIGSMELADFYSYFEACDLLTPTKKLTALGQGDELGKARKAPWVGALLALIEAKQLDNNMAAICRNLASQAGKFQVKLTGNSLLMPSGKSTTYQRVAAAILRENGYLRN
jgi:hypothetical protein